MLIYADESGDLGWKFRQPYQHGGSSRHLTIASVCIADEHKHLPKRIVRNLYKKFKWPSKIEKKWAQMKSEERIEFASQALKLARENKNTIHYHSITVYKQNVPDHIRSDENPLYNYMVGLSLLKLMSEQDAVRFFPDARAVKAESGNSLHDYLKTKLWFDKKSHTELETTPVNSAKVLNVQFADMLAGSMQSYYESNRKPCREILGEVITERTLYFPSEGV